MKLISIALVALHLAFAGEQRNTIRTGLVEVGPRSAECNESSLQSELEHELNQRQQGCLLKRCKALDSFPVVYHVMN